MKHFRTILLLIAVQACTDLRAQYETEWRTTVGSTSSDLIFDVCLSADQSVVVAGGTYSDAIPGYHDYRDAWLAKLDQNGNLVWSRCYGTFDDDQFNAVFAKPDGHYLAGGYSYGGSGDVPEANGSFDPWLIEVDANGDLVWQKNFGDPSVEFISEIIASGDGNYFLLCNTTASGPDHILYDFQDEYMVIKVDPTGNEFWRRTYGGSSFEYFYGAIVNDSSELVMTGYAMSDDGDVVDHVFFGGEDAWFLKTDAEGNILVSQCSGDSNTQMFTDIIEAPDSGYFALSAGLDAGAVPLDFYGSDYQLCRLDEMGQVVWQKNFGGAGYDAATKIVQDVNGYFVAGISVSAALPGFHWMGQPDFYVVKTDQEGNLIWEYCYGGSDFEGNGVSIKGDGMGGFVLAGTSQSTDGDNTTPLGDADGIVVKVTCLGFADIYTFEDTIICLSDTVSIYTTNQPGATIQWFKDGEAIPFATDTTYACTAPGVYYVEVTSASYCIKRSEFLNLVDTCGPEFREMTPYALYPNPSDAAFTVECILKQNCADEFALSIYSSRGGLIARYDQFSADRPATLNTWLEEGLYFIVVEEGPDKRYCLPFIKMYTD